MASFQQWRIAQLKGAAAARSLQDRLGIQDALLRGDQPLDVFAVIQRVGLTCIFQPLSSLLGAYITYKNVRGLIVTTERDLHMQRFTAAHELGHSELGHDTTSLDKEVGFAARGPLPATGKDDYDVQEIEADAFASELLLPKWLIVAHAKRQGWSRKELEQANVVYQLSLRLAVSYRATCWALAANDIVERKVINRIVEVPPKESKQSAYPDFEPDTWRDIDIWQLTERDNGGRLLGEPTDRLIVSLEEHVSAGYQWDIASSGHDALVIEKDERIDEEAAGDLLIGAPTTRRLVVTGGINIPIHLVEHRSWASDSKPIKTIELDVELSGREQAGLPRIVRRTRT